MSELAMPTLAEILRENALCNQIFRFLMEHENAMDSARGIAACWVDSDELSVRSALDILVECGAVTAHLLSSGTLYGLTRSPEARAWLRATFGSGDGRPESPPGEAQVER
jgi:hypothetical protein